MRSQRIRLIRLCMLGLTFGTAAGLSAQNRLVLPEGSVIIVRTSSALESATAQPNQTFETTIIEEVRVDDYNVIPSGSKIRGIIRYVQPATRSRSGVIEVAFDRLILTDGTALTMAGKLTSTNAEERRQIESSPDPRVVFVGGRGGIGAAIAGAGSQGSSASSLLTALGSMLSEGRNVSVPAGTTLAVQLEEPLVLRGRSRARAMDPTTIYTAVDRIRAAQQALAQRNYYRGAATGRLDEATQRALFEFQLDNRITPTGNLDGRTARALGITGGTTTPDNMSGVLTAEETARMRRSAQDLLGRHRQSLNISANGQLDSQRSYTEGELDLWFALSAFADNASLYEQLVRAGNSNSSGLALASRSLTAAAQRVENALPRARASAQIMNGWTVIRTQLAAAR